MAYTLQSRGTKAQYSERERNLFSLIPSDGSRVSSKIIIEKYWKNAGRDEPYNAHITAMGSIRSLKKKMRDNGEKMIVRTSQQRGPYPVDVWIEKQR